MRVLASGFGLLHSQRDRNWISNKAVLKPRLDEKESEESYRPFRCNSSLLTDISCF
jgi:hypothetical protein